jgi:predicted flap endonuclease-1-like 5' DNA nuclease
MLTQLKGLGPKAASILNDLGVTRFEQIASWNEADVAAIDARMGAFKGRITRDRWVDQAKLLARGDTATFEAEFGALGG